MANTQRRERERQATRQAILVAARQIARDEGWPALTIRKIAERIEYSPPTIYEFFASKDALLQALMNDGFRQIAQALRQAQAAAADPEAGVFATAQAYWSFANANPELYQVMYGLNGVPLDPQANLAAMEEVCAIALQALGDWAEAAGATIADPDGAVDLLWALLHGLVCLTLVGRMAGDEARASALIRRGVTDFLAGWRLGSQA